MFHAGTVSVSIFLLKAACIIQEEVVAGQFTIQRSWGVYQTLPVGSRITIRGRRMIPPTADCRPPTTEKLKKCIVDALTSKTKDARKLPPPLYVACVA
jgi:hypothetical protein